MSYFLSFFYNKNIPNKSKTNKYINPQNVPERILHFPCVFDAFLKILLERFQRHFLPKSQDTRQPINIFLSGINRNLHFFINKMCIVIFLCNQDGFGLQPRIERRQSGTRYRNCKGQSHLTSFITILKTFVFAKLSSDFNSNFSLKLT